jgi:WD40 repeat protein
MIAGGDNCESMHIYDFNSNKPISSYTGFNSDVTCVNFSYDQSRVYAGSFGGTLFVYNYDRGKVANTLRGHLTHWRWAVGQKEDMGNYIASGGADTNVKVWDLRQKGAIATYKGHDKAVLSIDMSPDTQFIASGWVGGVIKIWDLTAGKWAYSLDVRSISSADNCFVKDIKFNPADWCMAVAWSDKVVRYYDTSSYELINESATDVHLLSHIDFDPEGEVVISAYSDSIKVWDLEERKLVSMVSKTARPVFDCRSAGATDFTFLLENTNGGMGLSQISTSLITNKNSDLHDYEEEKHVGQSRNDKAANGDNSASLDFYTAPKAIPKVPNGKVLNQGHDYVYGLEDSSDLDNLNDITVPSPKINNENDYPKTNAQAQISRGIIKKQTSRKKVFWNNAKAMMTKPEVKDKKPNFGAPTSKPSLGKKVVLEGKGINHVLEINQPKNMISDVNKQNNQNNGVSKLTEEGLRKFVEDLNGNDGDLSTIRSEGTASLYEVPIDKPCGLNLEKFLNNVSNGITTTQTFGTLGQVPPIEVQRKVMEDIIKSNKTMLSVMNSRKIHLDNVKINWESGDLSKTLNALVLNKDTSAVMDFVNNTFVLSYNGSNHDSIRKNVSSIRITNCGSLLSHIYTLLNSKYETYLIWGIKALKVVFQTVSVIIFKWRDDIKNGFEVAGDIKNDEKSRRLIILMKQINKMVDCKGVTKGRLRQNTSGELIRDIIPDIELFMSTYNKLST